MGGPKQSRDYNFSYKGYYATNGVGLGKEEGSASNTQGSVAVPKDGRTYLPHFGEVLHIIRLTNCKRFTIQRELSGLHQSITAGYFDPSHIPPTPICRKVPRKI